MVNYRRSRVAGGSYFFTVNLRNRQSTVLIDHIEVLRKSFEKLKERHPLRIDAVVILPEHLHTIWTLAEDDMHYPVRWQYLKSHFTRALLKKGVGLSKNHNGEYNLWQRRYWEHVIRDEVDMQKHIEYIHYNPVKHGLVGRVKDWPHSSFHRYVEKRLVDVNWGTNYQAGSEEKYGE